MSYDLEIQATVRASPETLARLVQLTDGVSPVMSADGSLAEVVDDVSRAHAFSIDGPFELGPDDHRFDTISEGSVSFLYQIGVPSLDVHAIGLARRFAARLVDELGGRVFDPQVDEQVKRPTVDAPASGSSLEVAWYRLRDGSPILADAYLTSARDLLPAALPTRFGTYEPLAGRFPRDTDSDFLQMYRRECAVSQLFLRGKAMQSGYITGWTDNLRARYQMVRLSFDFSSLAALAGLTDIKSFFLKVAQRSGSFHAWTQLTTDRHNVNGARHFEGGWSGLTGDVRWLSWYEPTYAELVRSHLTPGWLEEFPEGMLHQLTDSPVEAMSIASKSTGPVLHSDFRPTVGSNGKIATPAAIMPTSLRRPEPGSPEAERIEANIARNIAKARRTTR